MYALPPSALTMVGLQVGMSGGGDLPWNIEMVWIPLNEPPVCIEPSTAKFSLCLFVWVGSLRPQSTPIVVPHALGQSK